MADRLEGVKLRFRENSLRLRVNRKEVEELAGGLALREEVHFPGDSRLTYLLEPFGQGTATASFTAGIIRIAAPGADVKQWANSDAVGIYFHLSADGIPLKIAIEKDLECLDAPPEEQDPLAFVRDGESIC